MEQKYYLIVSSAHDRSPIVLDYEPSEKEIMEYIIKLNGKNARVEKRYVLPEE